MRRGLLIAGLAVVCVAVGVVIVQRRQDSTTHVGAPVIPPTGERLLIHYGWDIADAASAAKNVDKIDALPFDGITISADQNPCGTKPVIEAAAQADMAKMPKLKNVKHNFLLCRFLDPALPDGSSPYAVEVDASWATMAANLSIYAKAAQATGMFDGFMLDTEYYGKGPNPWDYDSIPIPTKYTSDRPWLITPEKQAKSEARGRQITEALVEAWPDVVMLSLRGVEVSDPASFKKQHMGGYDGSWNSELAGAFFVGMVAATAGSRATLVDGGESYSQRTHEDFQNAYTWLKQGLPDNHGPLLPSGTVTSELYKKTVTVASQVFEKDMYAKWSLMPVPKIQQLLTLAQKYTDKYTWFYTETHNWRGADWPDEAVPDDYLSAVAASRKA